MADKKVQLVLIYVLILASFLFPPHIFAESFENCRQKLIQAQQLDVLADLDWKPPRQPKVVVGPTFFKIPFDAKQGFVETVNCFLVAGQWKFVNFDLLDQLNHRVIGRWENGRLAMK
jgi:hypothetical protein